MADFEYLDAAAVVDDRPWSSGLLRKVRALVVHLLEEHPVKAGYTLRDPDNPDNPDQVGNIHVGAYYLGMMPVPINGAALQVRIRIGTVAFGSEPATDVALYTHCTVGLEDGSVNLPPNDLGLWEHALTKNDSDSTVLYTEIDMPVTTGRGPVCAYLWVQSMIVSTDESTSTVTATLLGGGLKLSAAPSPAPSTGKAHRAVILRNDPGSKGLVDDYVTAPLQLGRYVSDNPNYYFWCIPPAPLPPTVVGTYSAALREIGTVELDGIELRWVGGPDLPRVEAYRTGRGCSWSVHQPLVSVLQQLIKYGRPVWSPAFSTHNDIWLFCAGPSGTVSGDRSRLVASTDTTADYVEIDRVLIPHKDGAGAGHECWVSAVCFLDAGGNHAGYREIWFRVLAYDLSGSLLATGDEHPFQLEVLQQGARNQPERDYLPIEHTLWGERVLGSWQYRGLLAGVREDWGRDVAQVRHYGPIRIDETDLTYPCELRIEARLSGRVTVEYDTATVVVNTACFARTRDVDPGV